MIVLAHRGVHDRRVTENTLLAFQRALVAGIDGIEFDLRISRDGVPVLIHDENLDRVAGDARRVRDLNKNELGNLVLRGQGSIPTLNEATSTVPAPFLLDMEIKDREVLEPLIKKLKTSNSLRNRTIISSFILDDLVQIKRELPEVKTVSLNRRWPLIRKKTFWKRLKDADVWGVGFPVNLLNQKRLQIIRKQGWQSVSWDLQPLKREALKLARLQPDVAIAFKIESCR